MNIKIKDIASSNFEGLEKEKLKKSTLSRHSLVANPNDDAIDVASAAERLKKNIILLKEADEIVGVIGPLQMIDAYREHKNMSFLRLSDALKEIERDPTEIDRNFHHEYLNGMRVLLQYCAEGDHYVEGKCPEH